MNDMYVHCHPDDEEWVKNVIAESPDLSDYEIRTNVLCSKGKVYVMNASTILHAPTRGGYV